MKLQKMWVLALLATLLMLTPFFAQAGNVYEDPEGRFSIPLVGDWTQVETDGTYALLELTGFPLNMYIVSADLPDLEVGVDVALRKIGIDPATLTLADTGKFGNWHISYHSLGDGKGVTVLAQVKGETTYCLVATGDETLTMNPPDHVVKTVGGFTFTGEEVILPTTVEEFEAYMGSVVGDKPPALSIVIALGGDILYAKGFGMADGPRGMAATPDTVYQWASMTKIVTATAIMQLYEKGLVDLDAPVSRYLTCFPIEHSITVRQLLSHSAGLPEPTDYVPFNLRLESQSLPDPDLWARRYLDEFTGPIFEPGSASAYSSPNSVILGQIVAEVSGKSYIEYARENILIPLGMKTTDFTYSSEAMISKAAAGAFPADEVESVIAMLDEIRGRGDGADFVREVDGDLAWMNRFSIFAPAGGGLIGPVTEIIRFLGMHLNGGEFEGVRILSAESASLMQETQLSTKGTPLGFGLGWEVIDNAEHPYVQHPGGGYGSQALMRLYPNEGFAIVIMSNYQGYDYEGVVDAAANVVFSMMGIGKEEPDIEGPDMGQALQGLLDQQVQEQGVLGMAMAVQLADGTVIGKASGYSDPSRETPYSVDTRTLIGSLTKTFTAVVVMQLVEEGKISLDDTLGTWFPDQPNADKITVRMLLSHTSGINNYLSSPNVRERASEEWAPMDLVAEANKLGPVDEPGGSDGFYSNTNFILLGLIIEEVTGKSWDEEIKSRIIESLGLRNTVYADEEGASDAIAGGYTKTEDGYQNLLGTYHPSIGWSAGAITSTVSDLIAYVSALFEGDLFIKSRETLDEILQPLASQDFGGGQLADFGLGLMRAQTQGMTIWMHPGDVPGYAAFIGYDPDTGATVAATVNTLGGNVIMPAISALQYVSQIQRADQGAAGLASAQRGSVYEDPEGRFSIPLVGDWTQVETDGTYAKFAFAEPPLNMHLVTVESDELYAGIDRALRRIDVDPAALTPTLAGETLGRWNVFMYSVGDGRGVTVLAQVKNEVTYAIIATGREDVVCRAEPPADVMNTILGFAFSGEEMVLPTTVQEFEAYINSFVGDTPPGLSIVIALGGDILYAKGFGLADGPKGITATPDTVYQWGSMVKMVTATAIMQLCEKGLVVLDGLVSDYLDYFPAEYPITVRQLLNHSAGLPEANLAHRLFNLDGKPLLDPDLAARAYVDEFTGPIFEPGSASAYANPHLLLAGQIVAEVSGRPYIKYVKENILSPLGMENTDFSYSSDAMIVNAAAHAVPAPQVEGIIAALSEVWKLGDAADLFREIDDRYAWMRRLNIMAAYGGLKGPPSEAIRFMQVHLNGGELDGVRILSPESVTLMQEIQLSTKGDPLHFTLGWFVIDDPEHPYVEHAGGGVGIRDLMRLYPNEGLAIVLMSNASGYDEIAVVDAAANVVFSMLAGQ